MYATFFALISGYNTAKITEIVQDLARLQTTVIYKLALLCTTAKVLFFLFYQIVYALT